MLPTIMTWMKYISYKLCLEFVETMDRLSYSMNIKRFKRHEKNYASMFCTTLPRATSESDNVRNITERLNVLSEEGNEKSMKKVKA